MQGISDVKMTHMFILMFTSIPFIHNFSHKIQEMTSSTVFCQRGNLLISCPTGYKILCHVLCCTAFPRHFFNFYWLQCESLTIFCYIYLYILYIHLYICTNVNGTSFIMPVMKCYCYCNHTLQKKKILPLSIFA